MDQHLINVLIGIAGVMAFLVVLVWVAIKVHKSIYQFPRNADEMEQVIELEAAKGMNSYYTWCLLILYMLVLFLPDQILHWIGPFIMFVLALGEFANQILRRKALRKYVKLP